MRGCYVASLITTASLLGCKLLLRFGSVSGPLPKLDLFHHPPIGITRLLNAMSMNGLLLSDLSDDCSFGADSEIFRFVLELRPHLPGVRGLCHCRCTGYAPIGPARRYRFAEGQLG
jgi:hypothetical protein